MILPDHIGGTTTPKTYSVLLEGPESTVCTAAPAAPRDSTAYQSEAELEEELIDQLCAQGYERARITSEPEMVANLRHQIEKLNGFSFTDSDWKRFFGDVVANKADGIVEKTRRIQQNPVIDFTFDDGTIKNVMLLDRDHIYRNSLQVLNQYATDAGTHDNRYDVTILVNGLPLVHIELKRRGVALEQAFNQIERYQRESFWSGLGLFEYVQLFIISNGTHTKYYSNTTRWQKVSREGRGKKSSASYQFTSWWTDADNHRIADLVPFAATFLSKGTILMILTHYCVLDVTDTLLVMRPYQICACERILNRILISEYDTKKLGTLAAGGYIWHTTGSGKTLTSFKTAQLAAQMEGVDKVLFVVDRKDLDYQTMKEYNKFQPGAVNGSRNTRALAQNLEAPLGEKKICVTTINKLDSYLKHPTAKPEVFDRHTVFIFDECHRSQFGKMHVAITKAFKNYHLFGFTGTPIFAKNADSGKNPVLKTTAQAFGDCLHQYTVVDAINDGNVLPFRIDYVSTFKQNDTVDNDDKVEAIDPNSAWRNTQRIHNIAGYILDHFDQKTKRNIHGSHRGFNSILACDSVKSAESYYRVLREMIGQRPGCNLKITTIFTFNINGGDDPNGFIDNESLETDDMPQSDREFLDAVIDNYNSMFHTNFDTDAKGFDGYYKDVSRRMKGEDDDGSPLPQSECLDLLIVVNMFLTGFDAKTLNTLWVDKNLKLHGLIQAFSRTNRILDNVKTYGNIVCFRNLEKEIDDAISLFGDPEAGGSIILKPYNDYLTSYDAELDKLNARFPFGTDNADGVMTDADKRDFVNAFSNILHLRNILTAFDDFSRDDPLTARALQDYQSQYIALHDELRRRQTVERESIADDLVFEMELVKRTEVSIDYILMLVEQRHGDQTKDKEIARRIMSSVAASPSLYRKADLIKRFLAVAGFGDDDDVHTSPVNADASTDERHAAVTTAWHNFINQAMNDELGVIIEDERLKPDRTQMLMHEAFETDGVPENGTAISAIMPPTSRFGANAKQHDEQRRRIIERLSMFYDRFHDIASHYPAN